MRNKRAYMRESRSLPSLADQEAALRAHGFKDFSDESPNVYVDRKSRRGNGIDAPLEQRDLMVAQTIKGDMIYVADASVLGRGERDTRDLIDLLGDRGALAVFDCQAGVPVKLTTESRAMLAFIERSLMLGYKAKSAAMLAERQRTGRLGGRAPDYTDAQVRAVKAVWLAHQGTNAQFEIAAGKVLSKPRLPYRTAYNWSRAGRRPWPPMGSEPAVMPRSKRSSSHAKR